MYDCVYCNYNFETLHDSFVLANPLGLGSFVRVMVGSKGYFYGIGMFDFPGGQIVAFCFTFTVGVGGFFLFRFLRAPSPVLLGSMVATGALNAAGFYPSFNLIVVSFFGNVLAGVMIGQ